MLQFGSMSISTCCIHNMCCYVSAFSTKWREIKQQINEKERAKKKKEKTKYRTNGKKKSTIQSLSHSSRRFQSNIWVGGHVVRLFVIYIIIFFFRLIRLFFANNRNWHCCVYVCIDVHVSVFERVYVCVYKAHPISNFYCIADTVFCLVNENECAVCVINQDSFTLLLLTPFYTFIDKVTHRVRSTVVVTIAAAAVVVVSFLLKFISSKELLHFMCCAYVSLVLVFFFQWLRRSISLSSIIFFVFRQTIANCFSILHTDDFKSYKRIWGFQEEDK